MHRSVITVFGVCLMCAVAGVAQANVTFNGAPDFEIDALGYYYIITGGKFPTGNVPNGDNGSTPLGGTFRFLTDDPGWGYPIDTWRKDDWFTQNASFALTLKNAGAIVYDNNGIEDGSYGNYYDATAQGLPSASTPGLYRGYSMSNNWDWIYAGYFKIETETTVDTLIGYFDENSGFDRNSLAWAYRMNIWSNVAGDLLPVNTGGFAGDVFSSDVVGGTFSWSDSGVDRVFGVDRGSAHDDIFRLAYTLDTPITLAPGVYWFSHDASVAVVPLPGALLLVGIGIGGVIAARRLRRRNG